MAAPVLGKAALLLGACLVLACGPSGGTGSNTGAAWNAESLDTELTAAFAQVDPYERMLALARTVPEMTVDNASGAGSAMARSANWINRAETDPIMSRWVSLDPEAALDWTTTRGGAQARDVIAQAIHSWVAADGGAGAVEFLKGVPPETERFKIVRNNIIKGGGASGNLDVATELIGAMPDDDTRTFMLLSMSLEIIRRDREMLKSWALSIPNDAPNDLKVSAFAMVLELLARSDPVPTAEWYDSLGFQPYKKKNSVYSVGGPYVLHDPAGGFEWILSQPPSETRENAIRDAAYLILKKQPVEAYAYLRANMANEGMGPAIYAYSHIYASGNPEAALEWAIRVPDTTERDKAVLLPLQLLGRRDIDAARKWLSENIEHVSEKNREKFEDEFGKAES